MDKYRKQEEDDPTVDLSAVNFAEVDCARRDQNHRQCTRQGDME